MSSLRNKFVGISSKNDYGFDTDTIYNVNYIKTIRCNDHHCNMTIANTATGIERSIQPSPHHGSGRDDTVETCYKDKNPECYNTLKSLVGNYCIRKS
jgi:hypothetical protein